MQLSACWTHACIVAVIQRMCDGMTVSDTLEETGVCLTGLKKATEDVSKQAHLCLNWEQVALCYLEENWNVQFSLIIMSFLPVSSELWPGCHAWGIHQRVHRVGICRTTYHREGTDQERERVKNTGAFCSQKSEQFLWCKNLWFSVCLFCFHFDFWWTRMYSSGVLWWTR